MSKLHPSIADGPNPEAARRALRRCGPESKAPLWKGPGRCPRCGYGRSISDAIRFQIDCDALEKVATSEDLRLLELATVNKTRRRRRAPPARTLGA